LRHGGTVTGDTVVVLGCGQRGLACAVAARAASASQVVLTGLARDRHKLEIASKPGVDATVEVDALPDGCPDVVSAVRDALGGEADRVVDTTPHAVSSIGDAIALVRPGGVVVAAGLKGGADMAGVSADALVLKAADVRGVVSVESWGYSQALRLLGSDSFPLELLHSHTCRCARSARGSRCSAARTRCTSRSSPRAPEPDPRPVARGTAAVSEAGPVPTAFAPMFTLIRRRAQRGDRGIRPGTREAGGPAGELAEGDEGDADLGADEFADQGCREAVLDAG